VAWLGLAWLGLAWLGLAWENYGGGVGHVKLIYNFSPDFSAFVEGYKPGG
jgi:hypothetical protein